MGLGQRVVPWGERRLRGVGPVQVDAGCDEERITPVATDGIIRHNLNL